MEEHLEPMPTKLERFFMSSFNAVNDKRVFINTLVKSLTSMSCGQIPLLYVYHAVFNLPACPTLPQETTKAFL